jgi:hypothetical protein
MTEQAISPLRRRMIEDMAIRKFAQKTQHDYVQRVKDFANYLKRSPDTANAIKTARTKSEEPKAPEHACPCCGSRMRIIETFLPGQKPKASRSPQHRPTLLPPKIRIDTS